MSVIVLDTSVLIAGLLSPRGAAAAFVDALFSDRVALAYTPEILAEYVEGMERPEFAGIITPADRVAIVLKLQYGA
jgi:predicted nucleic acid-binding protein